VPVLDWLLALRERNERAAKKCFALIKLLQDFGSELRRPRADILRDGVYELRTEVGNVNYRILYGFVGKDEAILVCGLTRERQVPEKEINLAAERIERYRRDPQTHQYVFEEE
jgi:hypothetical protein